ncbi:hypothetical protein SELR_pSRC300670 (plasmid) [Selenomonas ruminantium subsp. lactilytica TAM6421]|uniref:Uncharacterized protein n=1 Tax=Selenomonas ruminantium subsp. lactilytica (strain NBRC 103574 / TAM6421) TaxID=927704 RepID=I0GWK3_SELRL|nr:hypothetical protein [Selenomonas ruminantium]BAL85140.1 hypothetical protein SELR_pSRC300670 [Selenomonas ruminantium subsp. lactilytica TAM6421]
MLTARGEYENKKELLLYQIYSKVGMSPGPLELKACLEAFSDRFIDKLREKNQAGQE